MLVQMKTITRVKDVHPHLCENKGLLHAVRRQHLNRKRGIHTLEVSPSAAVATSGMRLPVGRISRLRAKQLTGLINVM